ncbi:hypothetical protein BO94DRAFT_509992 [Aspergillus sclerotioniger CBS 115572]|uniref:Endoplasmic reticulum junction formation protein lunapark n=1 Tax=Aspergillus sclerotioniger CBS 115572 TaxID=1450535 RepID=A0A317X5T4_9EURO|nr:hypothetical protein BO94DRAFT_509992 [Aspergillus sclerotioniger CBS 115572]PWY93976.1 hypothetical protein BO94DRAFT_509992 [Aspergillus sclerotioniger CBS 115572]
MVSLWPFKAEDTSPASFEKALAALSAKITRATTRLDLHRQHARRFKALWTLYTTFAYLLYSIILALVLGWQNWGVTEYAAIIGGPMLIYLIRTISTRYYDYRITKSQSYIDDLQKQREKTIEDLKTATRWNSTQQLLEKYGGESPKPTRSNSIKSGDVKRKSEGAGKRKQQQQQQQIQRTGLPPPPTANIRRPTAQQFSTPQHPPTPPVSFQLQQQQQQPSPYQIPGQQGTSNVGIEEPGFAPNAFSSSPQYVEHSQWYDRLLDVLLGEDETQPKNRIVLICSTCRLVNGQAPPGVKTLEELGRWRCGSCGAWNGVESEAKKVLAGIRKEPQSPEATWEPVSSVDGETRSSVGDVTDEGVMVAASDDQLELHSSGGETPEEPEAEEAEEEAEEEEEEEEPQPEPSKRMTRARAKSGRRKG